jgi:hypothetical protein
MLPKSCWTVDFSCPNMRINMRYGRSEIKNRVHGVTLSYRVVGKIFSSPIQKGTWRE